MTRIGLKSEPDHRFNTEILQGSWMKGILQKKGYPVLLSTDSLPARFRLRDQEYPEKNQKRIRNLFQNRRKEKAASWKTAPERKGKISMKRKTLALLAAGILLLPLAGSPIETIRVNAEEFESAPLPNTQNSSSVLSGQYNNLHWSIENGVLTIRGSGPMKELDNKGDYYPWQSGECRQSNVKKIVIEEGVTSIGLYAFRNMETWDLTEGVKMPASLISIGEQAFSWNKKLPSILFPENLKNIDANAFDGCDNLAEIVFTGTAVPSVGYSAFTGGPSNRIYYIPENWAVGEGISPRPGHQIKQLYSVKAQSNDLRYGIASASPIELVRQGTQVSANAQPDTGFEFTGWTVKGPEGFVLENSSNPNVTFLMPEGSVALTANFQRINTASGTHGDNLTWKVENGVLTISGTGEMKESNQRDYPWHKSPVSDMSIKKIVIEEGVTSIANFAFEGLSNWSLSEGLELPDSLASIGKFAFMRSSLCAPVVFPPNLHFIGIYAFDDCINLNEVIFTGLTAPDIDGYAFSGPKKSFFIPADGKGYDKLADLVDQEMKYLYSLAANVDPSEGTVSVEPDSLMVKDTKVTVNAVAKDGYVFKEWQIEKGPEGFSLPNPSMSDLEFNMPEGSVTLKAVFEKITSGDSTGNGSGSNSGSGKPVTPAAKENKLYRLYNPNSGEHFYTLSTAEKVALIKAGWDDEGLAWIVPAANDNPVYRLYNPNAGDHHYTLDQNEKEVLTSLGWKDEGIGFYSATPQSEIPVYRQYNPNAQKTGAHNYTTNKEEHDYLCSIGWKDEGIGFWAIR